MHLKKRRIHGVNIASYAHEPAVLVAVDIGPSKARL